MKRGIGFPMRWQAAAVAIQVSVVAVCGVAGWQLLHPHTPGGAVTINHPANAPAAAPALMPSILPRVPAGDSAAVTRPALGNLIDRVNRDDARLYSGQWATIQVIASATRNYLVNRVVPLLLAAAKGGSR